MKVSASAVLALALLPSAGAFVSHSKTSASPCQLSLHTDKSAWLGPAATAAAGLTLASQIAGATPVPTMDAVAVVPPMIQQGRNRNPFRYIGSSFAIPHPLVFSLLFHRLVSAISSNL